MNRLLTMVLSKRMFSPRLLSTLLPLFLSATLALPASAQQVRVQNGATLQVQNGSVLNLQGGQMDLGSAGSAVRLAETSAGRVAGGTLTATRALSSPSGADPAGLGAAISASVDLGDVTVTRGHTAQTASNGNSSIERYYDISPSKNNSGLSADLTLTYHDEELNGLAESNLELFKSDNGGSSWTQKGADSRSAGGVGGNTVTLTGDVSSFSSWTLGSSSSPLPVELASFEGAVVESGSGGGPARGAAVRLRWQTASETNSAGFEVQRHMKEASSGNGTWQQVGYVESKAEGGTASETLSYRFTDGDIPYAADSLSYRLRQVDTDGSATLTDPVTVGRSGPAQLQLLGTAPNPARRQVAVRYGLPEAVDGEATLRLYDVLGRRVRSVQVTAEAGRHKQTLSVGDLASGTYFLRLTAGGQAVTQKLPVVR